MSRYGAPHHRFAGPVIVGSTARLPSCRRSGDLVLRFGIYTERQYQRAGPQRRDLGSHVAYTLLDVGNDPNDERVSMFEDVCFRLRTSNGTFRTSFAHRFVDLDKAALRWIDELFAPDAPIRIQDRAASHCLTSHDFAQRVFATHATAEFEASDLFLCIYELSLANGEKFIVEPSGQPLQYIRPPFVLSACHREPRRYPVNLWLGLRARRRFARLALPEGWMKSASGPGYRVRPISCVHPRAATLAMRDPRFRLCTRSVFEPTPHASDVLRTMNILNRAYFGEDQLATAVRAAFDSVRPGGLWIVGRTWENDFSNHATFFLRGDNGWRVLGRIGQGSELEQLALAVPPKSNSNGL